MGATPWRFKSSLRHSYLSPVETCVYVTEQGLLSFKHVYDLASKSSSRQDYQLELENRMPENRTSGSEVGGAGNNRLPLPEKGRSERIAIDLPTLRIDHAPSEAWELPMAGCYKNSSCIRCGFT